MRCLAAVLVLVTGCSLYSHGDDDCNLVYAIAHGDTLRDPYTGQCRDYPSADCYDACAPCPPVGAQYPAQEEYALCNSYCDPLSESRCFETNGCRAAYQTDRTGAVSFLGCWAVAVAGPYRRFDACEQLDVLACPYRDDCTTWYSTRTGTSAFDHCAAEGKDSCEPGTCGAPPPCPANSVATTRNGCYTGRCIARSECPGAACADLSTQEQCALRTDCEPVFHGDDCTCTPASCTCETQTFERCQNAPR